MRAVCSSETSVTNCRTTRRYAPKTAVLTYTSVRTCDLLRIFRNLILARKIKIRCRAHSEPDSTRWRTGGEVKGKLANGVGSQYSHATSERGLSSITQADAHTSAASSRLNWRPHRFKWTRPFRGKTKSGFCACAITFRTSYTLRVPSSSSANIMFFYGATGKIGHSN